MKLTNEFDTIRKWANERNLYQSGTTKTQFIKLIEEVGELGKAILKKDSLEVQDAIGDIVVVLTNLTELANNDIFDQDNLENGAYLNYNEKRINIEDCINNAYSVIKNRKGKMVNETFVKDGI